MASFEKPETNEGIKEAGVEASAEQRLNSIVNQELQLCRLERDLVQYVRESCKKLKTRATEVLQGTNTKHSDLSFTTGWTDIEIDLLKLENAISVVETHVLMEEQMHLAVRNMVNQSPSSVRGPSLLKIANSDLLKRWEDNLDAKSVTLPKKMEEVRSSVEAFFNSTDRRLTNLANATHNGDFELGQRVLNKMQELLKFNEGFENN